MSPPRVPILETILKAWADGFRAIRDMPVVAACALVLLAAIATGAFFAAGAILLSPGRSVQQWAASPAWFVFGVFNGSARIVLLAPLAIAVHRYIICGERARRYPLNPLRPSYLRYVGTALAIFVVFRLPEMIGLVLRPAREILVFDLPFTVLMLAMMVTVAVVVLGKIALFPAIAVNAPNASWRAMPQADAGNAMRIIVILIAIVGPGQLAGWLAYNYVPAPHWPGGAGQLVPSLAMVLLDVPVLCALAAAMSRIYLAVDTSPAPAPAIAANQPAVA
jgi:hypothetical protein